MNREETDKNDVEQDNQSDNKFRAFQIIEERIEKRRRRASFGRLISYIAVLIMTILLILYLKRLGL